MYNASKLSGRGAEYALTRKGLDLLPAMLELVSWSARHDARTAAPAPFVERIRGDRERLVRQLKEGLEGRYGV